jgi:undecaprenyl-diphosphatase
MTDLQAAAGGVTGEFHWVHALILGLVQGLTEYLPVSSSAHLILAPRFLGVTDPGLAFDVFLHLGTLAATLIYFRSDWLVVFRSLPLRAFFGAPLSPRLWLGQFQGVQGGRTPLWLAIALGTLPALAVGAIAHSWIESSLRGNAILAATLTLGGLALYFADLLGPRTRDLGDLKLRDALWVGTLQCLALVPGVSRSGSTLIAGRLLGFDRASAARFSFLLSAPVTAAALLFELRKFNELLASVSGMTPLLVGASAAFVSGWLAIDGLLRLLRRFGFLSFAIYRAVLAIVILKVLGV